MSKTNYKNIKKVLYLLLLANLFVTIAKIVIGFTSKSMALSADGFHSLSDSATNIIGIISITFASKPEDKEHPYGHKKFETMASLIICVALTFIAYNIVVKSISKISNPSIVEISFESLIILIGTVVINIFVSTYENKKGKEYNSSFLIADSIHTKSDIFISIGVITTLICIKIGLPPIIDVIFSLVVSVFILHAAYEIFIEATSILTDKVVIKNEEVKEVINEFSKIKSVHKIRSRGFKDNIFLDMHILVDNNLNVDQVHQLVHEVENKFREKLNTTVDLVIHVEPYCEEELKKIN